LIEVLLGHNIAFVFSLHFFTTKVFKNASVWKKLICNFSIPTRRWRHILVHHPPRIGKSWRAWKGKCK